MDPTVNAGSWNATTNIDRWLEVSAYCDRWCERCRHRTRCLMAGSGQPDPLDLAGEDPELPLDEEEDDYVGEPEIRPMPSMDDEPLTRAAMDWFEICVAWLSSLPQQLVEGDADDLFRVMSWYALLVPNKLYLAHFGLCIPADSCCAQCSCAIDPNGSAKVAALGLHACLNVLGRWCQAHPLDQNALHIMLTTGDLLTGLQQRFPDHMSFRRPGFED